MENSRYFPVLMACSVKCQDFDSTCMCPTCRSLRLSCFRSGAFSLPLHLPLESNQTVKQLDFYWLFGSPFRDQMGVILLVRMAVIMTLVMMHGSR